MLSGVLERSQPPRTEPAEAEPTEAGPKGRGPTPPPSKAPRAPAARTAKRIKGRTVYLPDDLFERIIVQAHRKDLTISDYIALLLDRHVPDHRVIRSGPAAPTPEADQAEAVDA